MIHLPTKIVTAWNFIKAKVLPAKVSAINAQSYWESRYNSGGNSGAGSWKESAQYKAEIINHLVDYYNISSVIEFGCGDGGQLCLYKIPEYIGFDVSRKAIEKCTLLFKEDKRKSFFLASDYSNQKADAAISIDVIYHIVDDSDFNEYMKTLFKSSASIVLIYSTDTEKQKTIQAPHVKHRKFSHWIEKNAHHWEEEKISLPPKIKTIKKPSEHTAKFYLYIKNKK